MERNTKLLLGAVALSSLLGATTAISPSTAQAQCSQRGTNYATYCCHDISGQPGENCLNGCYSDPYPNCCGSWCV